MVDFLIILALLAVPIFAFWMLWKAVRAVFQPKARDRDSKPLEWESVEIERRHPGKDWVNSRDTLGQTGKLISIRDAGHREPRQRLVAALKERREYQLLAVREPDNPYDPNAIRIDFAEDDQQAVPVGYIERSLAKSLADRFTPEMPLKVYVEKLRWAKGTDKYFISVMVLIPKKKDRQKYEKSQA